MWNEIGTQKDLDDFIEKFYGFHDSCIKEMKYTSGAFVTDDLAMSPVNSKRILTIIIERQFDDIPVVELEFSGLKYLKLYPVQEEYTCEILDSTFIFKDGYIYWMDIGGLNENQLDDYQSTLVCAKNLRWRAIDVPFGDVELYSLIDN